MTSAAVPFSPRGWPIVVPRIVANDGEGLVGFLQEVFGATGTYSPHRPAEMKIGSSIILISDTGERQPVTAFLYVYVKNADETYHRALDAGATVIEEPSDQPYGDRRAMVQDRWGNIWQIATHARKSRGA